MRMDTLIKFRKITNEYDYETGDYSEDTIEEDEVYGDVTDSGRETMLLVYGKIKQGSKTIRIQNHYDKPFDRIVVDNVAYRVDMERRLRTKHTFIVSEVQ